ncbi:unnamed protein product [Phaedon cochleariae]|uniref:ABC transporter G family member 23 n=1 Tax=Phaedon cochleariae TaxID=80249 RepID=A0A9N9X2Y0_PHACE|nr:unnamed protein product [Phaedon cochleariae]
MHDNNKYAVYAKDVERFLGQIQILKKICMNVERGQIYGLLGPSGCGKTTLLNSIVGRKKIDGGEILVLGKQPGDFIAQGVGRKIGFMPQEIALVGEFTVRDAIYYFGRIYDMKESLIQSRYEELKRMLDLPPSNRYLKKCSGGQQRRVSLAVTLVHNPELLILDEPTVGIDPLLRERIWNQLLQLTRIDNVAVIITTHYIEECRQADKIALITEGKLLAETSPDQLLTLCHAATLEEAFLSLCHKQKYGEPIDFVQRNESNGDLLTTNTALNESVDTPKFTEKTISANLLTSGLKTIANSISTKRMKALLDKNWKQLYRNYMSLIFVLLLPIGQKFIFMNSMGREVIDIPLGIVNDETKTSECFNHSSGSIIPRGNFTECHLSNMSCRFLDYLEDRMIRKDYYTSIEEAYNDAMSGKIYGIVYLSQNYTSSLEERLSMNFLDVIPLITVDSRIKVWLDMSNMEIGTMLQQKIFSKYLEYQESLYKDCKFAPGSGDLPIRIDTIYGEITDEYLVYMVPGGLITMIFFICASMTSQIMVSEKHEGIWDRSIIAGVKTIEIIITHFIIQGSLAIIQTIGMLAIVYGFYQHNYIGNMWLMFFIMYVDGICGMSFGFFVSVISSNQTMANITVTGVYLPMMLLCGLVWPIEGMPLGLQYFSKCLPFTLAIESFRNVAKKAWYLDNLQVLHGIGVAVLWTFIFGIFSLIVIKKQR